MSKKSFAGFYIFLKKSPSDRSVPQNCAGEKLYSKIYCKFQNNVNFSVSKYAKKTNKCYIFPCVH